jgi:hypothetical protein
MSFKEYSNLKALYKNTNGYIGCFPINSSCQVIINRRAIRWINWTNSNNNKEILKYFQVLFALKHKNKGY